MTFLAEVNSIEPCCRRCWRWCLATLDDAQGRTQGGGARESCHPMAARWPTINMKKAIRETQTLRAGCSKAEPKIFAPPQTTSRGRGTAKI